MKKIKDKRKYLKDQARARRRGAYERGRKDKGETIIPIKAIKKPAPRKKRIPAKRPLFFSISNILRQIKLFVKRLWIKIWK